MFALGIAVLGGCDPDSTSHLLAPADIPVLTGDTIQCPYGSHTELSGCESVEFIEDNPWLSALQLWFQEIEGPTAGCTAAYNAMEAALSGGLTLFTYSGDSADPTSHGVTLRTSPGSNLAVGMRRGTGFGLDSSGSIVNDDLFASVLLHEGFHLIGGDGIDSYQTGPGGTMSACQSYNPTPV